MPAINQNTITISYTLLDKAGTVLDQVGDSGIAVHLDKMELPSALMAALKGKQEGEEFELSLKAEDAYGLRDEDLITAVARQQFADLPELSPGMQLEAQLDDGVELVWVKEVSREQVILDLNHPLAGLDLIFKVKVLAVGTAK